MNASADTSATVPDLNPGLGGETPDIGGAYPRLSVEQIAELAEHGVRRRTRPGQVVVAEGQREREFMVVLAGTVAVYEDYCTPRERVIRVHGPRRFLDELGLLTGQPSFVTCVVREPGEVLAVPLDGLRRIVGRDRHLGDVVLSAFLIRRELLIAAGAGLRIIGSRYSADSRRLREFAARNRLPHQWVDLESDPGAEELLRQLGVGPGDTPVVIWRGTRVLRNPSNAELAELTGFDPPTSADGVCDLVVVGAGPAGLAAAVYGASEGLSTVVLDAIATGGQAGTSSRIENYLGFPAGISGAELADRAVIQAEKFGARLGVPVEATGLARGRDHIVVRVDPGSEFRARAVVVATGARYRRLNVPGLADFEGRSVYYAATLVEAQYCRQRPVAVVGGGNSAGQATVFLAQHSPKVYLLVRGDDLAESMSRYLVDQIERNPAVELMCNSEIRELRGRGGELDAVVAENTKTGERRTLDVAPLFVFIGAEPCTGWLAGSIALDDRGFVLTGDEGAEAAGADPGLPETHGPGRPPHLLETSWPGVFAVGDVRSGSVKRLTSAVGEGAMAIRLVHELLIAADDFDVCVIAESR
ncbi:MAG TPA: FAD-dependent oxidoreductase [Sporichthyaceae bacterium]|jgi:thioredoxin reductase (NADPH)|nr:FAD-dependent oxidoreductase [Sporichthyaceae bacterium]